MKKRSMLMLSGLFLFVPPAEAQIPQTMHYQGSLSDSSGVPVIGPHTLAFAMYDQVSGGSALWAETLMVNFESGLFSVTLGGIHPLDLPFDAQYWLGLSVDGSAEFDPRTALAAAPYSLNAKSTLIAPQPGQSLSILDTAGSPVHVLSATGGSTHFGKSTFDGGGDTAVVIHASAGPALVVLTGDTALAVAALRRADRPLDPTASADPDSSGPGMIVGAGNGGLIGTSPGSFGVRGISNTGPGISGHSGTGPGGDFFSSDGPGGQFRSFLGPGITVEGFPAGAFKGDVNVRGEVFAQSLHVATFDSTGAVVDTLTSFFSDGTSEHSGLEKFNGGIELTAGNLKFPDGTSMTTAGSAGGWVFSNDSLSTDHPVGISENLWVGPGPESSARLIVDGFPGTKPAATVGGALAVRPYGDTVATVLIDPDKLGSGYVVYALGDVLFKPEDTAKVGAVWARTGGSGLWKTPVDYDLRLLGQSALRIVNQEGQPAVTELGPGYVRLRDSVTGSQTHVEADQIYFQSPADTTLKMSHWTCTGFSIDHNLDGNVDIQYDSGNGGRLAVDLESNGTYDFEVRKASIPRITCRALLEVSGASCSVSDNLSVGGQFSALNATVSGNATVLSALAVGPTSASNIITVRQGSATDPIADAWTMYSSRRWKKNIRPIERPLEKVQKLRGVEYDWKATGAHDIGLVAEEVGAVIPEVVAYEENGIDARGLDYARLVALLIEAVKAQQERIDLLERRQGEMASHLEGLPRSTTSGGHGR